MRNSRNSSIVKFWRRRLLTVCAVVVTPSFITCSNTNFIGNSGSEGGQEKKEETAEQPTEVSGGFGLTCLAESPVDVPSDYTVLCGFTAVDGSKLAPSDKFDFEVVLKNAPSGIVIRKEPRGEKYTFEFDIKKSDAATLVLETKAVNIKDSNSEIKALAFEFQKITQIPSIVAQPTILPNPGSYSAAQSVNITTTTQGAHIKYTIDDTDPSCDTSGSGTLFSTTFSVSSTTTIKAIGCKSGDEPSPITTATLTIAPQDICGQPGNSCYDLQGIQENAVRKLHGALVEIQYVKANPSCTSNCFLIWKEKAGDKILNASGVWDLSRNLGWQKKLVRSGRRANSSNFTFQDASNLAGRACPEQAMAFDLFDVPKPTAGICLYYDDGSSGLSLHQHNNLTLGEDYLEGWNDNSSGEGINSAWYEGNINICANNGMRLPTLYETNSPKPSGADESALPDTPGGTDPPTFEGNRQLGVPGVGNAWTWTASAVNYSFTPRNYWVWKASDIERRTAHINTEFPVRCVLPATTTSN